MELTSFIDKLNRQVAPGIYDSKKVEPIVVAHPAIGEIGYVTRQGFRHQRISLTHLNAILRDEERFLTNESFRKKMLKKLTSEAGVLASWDDVLNARANGRNNDFFGLKSAQTTVANQWSFLARSTGVPSAMTYSNIPGGLVPTNLTTGALPLTSPGALYDTYLLVPGLNMTSGTNVVMFVDLLVAAGNISATSITTQTVNSSALTRYTDGNGVYMTYEVTTALGGTASNMTVTYTNQAGTGSRSSGSQTLTTSCITFRTQPIAWGWSCPLQAGDFGVRSVESLILSASMTAGVMALLIFKPLFLMPTLSTLTWVEKPVPSVLSQITKLPKDASNNTSCIVPYAMCSTTSSGTLTCSIHAVNG